MNIVVGALDTPEGRAAMQRAAAEARDKEGVLHIVAYAPVPRAGDASSSPAEELQAREASAARLVEQMVTPDVATHVHVPPGAESPADAILRVAREQRADLIVIGMRRRSRVGKLVLGSTAQDILLGADAPVLSVKAPDT